MRYNEKPKKKNVEERAISEPIFFRPKHNILVTLLEIDQTFGYQISKDHFQYLLC